MLEDLRRRVCRLNRELPRQGLVTMTSGNVSGRDPVTGLVAIKPSGVLFDDMQPDHIALVGLDGVQVFGRLQPSIDTETHLYIYQNRPDVMGIVHTHSNYATSFAVLGEPIACCLTAMADEFGGPIPCGPYAPIGSEAIGRAVVDHIGRSPAILLQNHGVFALGASPEAALKAAVMTEDVAHTMHLALLRGRPLPIAAAEIERLYEQYHTRYGQKQEEVQR
jgi:L-ribulose-5-phosphate 4-epimerase